MCEFKCCPSATEVAMVRLLAGRPSQLRDWGLPLVGLGGAAAAVVDAAFSVDNVGIADALLLEK